ncbi:MAG: ABC transporter ATP-binding protein [Desulfobulbaceae bacterium]|nr:ABC transporter ATP-binding protein [Desulfobulbaceae bacterium]
MTELFSIDNISCAYGNQKVLHELSFSLTPGLFYGLIGPNGSGKTTLLDLILGNLTPHCGEVRFKDREVTQYSRRELAKEIALVPQDFRINFDFTVFDVVMMGRHPHIRRFANPSDNDHDIVNNVLAELEIDNLKNRLITQLSGGEKQRVIIARALAQNTPVLILDEATSSLDIQHSLQIFQVLKERSQAHGATIVAAIHDLNFAAAYCDTIILLNQGRLTTIGPPPKVLNAERLQQVFAIDCHAYLEPFSGAHQIAYRY